MTNAGFVSIENLEHLEAEGQSALMPIGGWSSKPKAKLLGENRPLEVSLPTHERPHVRYANPKACRQCARRLECTKALHRMIYRDGNQGLKEQMG